MAVKVAINGFGIGYETKVKNWLQEAVSFWEAHR